MPRRMMLVALLLFASLVPSAQAQTFLRLDINTTDGGGASSYPSSLVSAWANPAEQRLVFFVADDGSRGTELWRSDGTPAGTTIVRDIWPGEAGSAPSELTELWETSTGESYFYFVAGDEAAGRELWISNGTITGTQRVKDIAEGMSSSNPEQLTFGKTVFSAEQNQLRQEVFFIANDKELWVSDGTNSGTKLLRGFPEQLSPPRSLTRVAGGLFFALETIEGWELWHSDGTSANTRSIKLIGAEQPREFVSMAGTLYFSAGELWRSDGTSANTQIVKEIAPGAAASQPFDLTVNYSQLFFTADDGTLGRELYRSDGTAAGTVLIKDITPGPTTPEGVGNLTSVAGLVFFVGDDGQIGSELWTTDGTAAGTVRVADIRPGPASSFPSQLQNVNGQLIFNADDGVQGIEPYIVDVPSLNTFSVRPIANLASGQASSFADEWHLTGRRNPLLFFAADDNVGGVELWVTPGRNVLSLPNCGCPMNYMGRICNSGVGRAAGLFATLQQASALDLALLQRVRDEVLEDTVEGRLAIDRYEQYGPEVVQLLALSPSLFDAAVETVLVWQPHLEALVSGGSPELTVGENEARILRSFLRDLAAVASPELRDLIEAELARPAIQQMEGKPIAELRTAVAGRTPTISWPTPAAISYGVALGPAQLNATAGISGSLSYSPAPGSLLPAGSGQIISVTFRPADTANYDVVTASVQLEVRPAPLSIRADDKTRADGEPNPPLTLSYTGFVAGEGPASLDVPPTITTSATLASGPGRYPITVSGASDPNYAIGYVAGTLTVADGLERVYLPVVTR
jgi:ELWxxDGT repeat protein